jgi:hypothetical protein
MLITDKKTGKKVFVATGQSPARIQVEPTEHMNSSPSQTGPSAGQQSALNLQAGTKTLTIQLKNTATTGDALKAVIFDAYGAFAEANNYTKDSDIVVTAKNFLNAMFLKELETGFVYHCHMLDYTITKPTDDISQFDNSIKPFVHSSNVTSSQPLPAINPSDYSSAFVNQKNVKNLDVDFDINASLALELMIELDTVISLTFHVTLKQY